MVLHNLLEKFEITSEDIIKSHINWDDVGKKKITKVNHLKRKEKKEKKIAMQELDPFTDCTSKATRLKMVSAKITYSMIVNAFKENKYFGIAEVLGEDENQIVKVTKCPKVIKKIYAYLIKNVS